MRALLAPVPCPGDAAGVRALLPRVAAALDGTGPPLALLPTDPAAADRNLAAVHPQVAVEAAGVAAVVTTSGSTGEPKGVLLPAAALRASSNATLDRLGGPGQWLLALPAHYVAGLQVVVRSVVAGTEPVALDPAERFSAERFAAATAALDGGVRRYTALVPAQLARLLDDPAGRAALAGYDAVLLGGAAAPPRLLDLARTAGARIVTTYGMSETCGGCVYDGFPLAGVRVDVRADGRVRLAGPMLATGYRLRPDLTSAAFETGGRTRWHVTPDLGRLTVEGRLEVLGRADDVAVSGGVKVPLATVERAVCTHPAVDAAACVAVPDDEWGERVVAFVVPRAAPPPLAKLRAHVARTLPRTWAPREVVAVAELPLLTSGKPDRQALRRAPYSLRPRNLVS